MASNGDRSEIAFFDLETTLRTRPGQGIAILEFGSILVCPRNLVELQKYSTLVRPVDLSLISNLSVRHNGITKHAVLSAPTFAEIADTVYHILHGRIWAGHNILRFDCDRIREAFAEINRPAPEPMGMIDSYPLLSQTFGTRAGDMKMATLATYFGLGKQTHRSLDDVRMNLEVLKYCATLLFLESNLPDIFTTGIESPQLHDNMDEEAGPPSAETSMATASDGYSNFVEPHEVSSSSVTAGLVPFYRGIQKIQILHHDVALQICCFKLKVRFGLSMKYWPRLSFVVDASSDLRQVLDECDSLAQTLSVASDSCSEWRPVVRTRPGCSNSPTIRLNLPAVNDGDTIRWTTEIYHRESSPTQQIVFSQFDVPELEALLSPGTLVDAYFTLDSYDYPQNAGIRLVAKKLVL